MNAAGSPKPHRRLIPGLVAAFVLVAALVVLALTVTGALGSSTPVPSPSEARAPSFAPRTTSPTASPPTVDSSSVVCAATEILRQNEPGGIPLTRAVNVGVEDLVDARKGHLVDLVHHLDQVNANTVSIAVGRLDWVKFPWAEHESALSSDVLETGRDYVAEAIHAFRCTSDGRERRIVLGIDVLLGRQFDREPWLAGRSQNGEASNLFASVSAWKSGPLRERLVAFAQEVAVRYDPDAINITELFFDQYSYGDDDFADFRATTGLSDWPRRTDGSIDAQDPAVSGWRTDAARTVYAELQRTLDPLGVELTADVRSPLSPDRLTRSDIGQGYSELLAHVSVLNVWDFPGIDRRLSAFRAADLAPMLFAPSPDRYSLEVGLWSGLGAIPAEVLAQELGDANIAGISSVSVTPASLMSDELWAVVAEAWAR